MRPASETTARDGPSGAGGPWCAQPDSPGSIGARAQTTIEVASRRARITPQFSAWRSRWYAFRVWRRRNDGALPLTGPATSPLIIGHRGASAIESENSVGAFARARADGADGVELDAMICGTGEVIVFHDDDLLRLGGRPERIGDTSFAVLRGVTLTSGATIPTLAEVFEACGPDLLGNVERKVPSHGPAALAPLVDGVATIIERAGATGRVLVSSFHPRAVRL